MIMDIALTQYQPFSTSNLIVLIIAVLLRNSATVGSTLLTPTADYSCPGERVIFKCIVNNGARLHWNVEFSDPELAMISQRFLTSDALGQPKFISYTREHTFEFNLTSNSPGALISTASTIAEQRLEGTRVSCRDMNFVQNTSVIHIIQSPINIGSILKTNEMPTGNQIVIVYMSLNVSANTVGEYFVNVTPSVESGPARFTTENSNFQLSVLYNREYTVSVVANNCAGNGTLATATFTISKKSSNVSQIDCGLPTLLKGAGILTESYTTTESSQITLICTEGPFLNTTIISTCTREGKWYPDPTKFSCLPERSDPNSNHNCSKKQPLVGYIITGLSTSILFFTLGVFCTVSIHWCQLRQKRCTRSRVAGTTTGVAGTNNGTNINVSQGGPQQQLSEPVYAECSMSISHEELELNTDSNIAYRHPQVNNMYVSLDQN